MRSGGRWVARVAMLGIIAACAAAPRVDKLYQDPEARDSTFKRVLVIGIAGDGEMQRKLERLVSRQLQERQVTAVPG